MLTATQTLPATTILPRPMALFSRLLRQLQAFSSLSPLSDAQLRDIGLTRADVQILRDVPLSADACTRLHIAATRRPGDW